MIGLVMGACLYIESPQCREHWFVRLFALSGVGMLAGLIGSGVRFFYSFPLQKSNVCSASRLIRSSGRPSSGRDTTSNGGES